MTRPTRHVRHNRRPYRQKPDRADPATEPPGLAARRTATKLLSAVVDAHTPLDALTDGEHGHPHFLALEPRDRALVRAILATALRFRVTLENLIAARLDRPLPPNASALGHILHVAAAQSCFLDVPDSAAVDLAVTQARSDPRTARFSGLVNAVLRRLAREKEEALPAALARTTDAPEWFTERLATAYGDSRAAAILAVHRTEAPVDFTVKSDAAGWAARLGGIVLPTGSVRVEHPEAPVAELPGYTEGAWWVQDTAASLPARLFGEIAGLRIADLCAAPGGKTAQLAHAGAKVTAIDLSKNRLARLEQNLARLDLAAETIAADVTAYRPAELFDAVLLDAPCSSTGTIRRHPDVPWTKRPEDIGKLAALQRRLLARAATLVKPGGRIVFSNCSLDPAEGEDLLTAFLAETSGVEIDPIGPDEAAGIAGFILPSGALRTTPEALPAERPRMAGLDGFFAARLRRVG